MRQDLWNEQDDAKNRADFTAYQSRHNAGTAMIYLAVDEHGQHTGFLEAELRSDYVEGTQSSPTWYVEGLYTVPEQRGRGVAAGLVNTLIAHAQSQGYAEIASDCELNNKTSEAFHKAIGFKEVTRSIHFIKKLT